MAPGPQLAFPSTFQEHSKEDEHVEEEQFLGCHKPVTVSETEASSGSAAAAWRTETVAGVVEEELQVQCVIFFKIIIKIFFFSTAPKRKCAFVKRQQREALKHS